MSFLCCNLLHAAGMEELSACSKLGVFGPALTSKTDTEASSDSREATTQPADPAPTTMKSKFRSIFGVCVLEPVLPLHVEDEKVSAAEEGRQPGKAESLRSRIAKGSQNNKGQN
eukprot:2522280-Rhodomonas_salina.1